MKLWKLKPEIPEDISQKLSAYPKLLAQLLYDRGLTEQKEIEEFLEVKYEGLNSPFLFQDMQKAVDRVWQAINQNQKICIYGDYDADAVTANAVLQQTFRYLGVEVESYIPDRFTEGYGINIEALEKIRDGGCKVIITVDCGTNSIDAAEFCSSNKIDLIITDHHEVIAELPKAFAVINPKNRKDSYPFEDITGVGVAFKMAQAILKNNKLQITNNKVADGWEKWLLDLVAIGTVADCHSLLGENRVLVKYGLKVLAKTKWPGLRALVKISGSDFSTKAPDTYTLGFVIAPRLNAAGRLEHADSALHLLMEKDSGRAQELAGKLENINSDRQGQTGRALSEAKEQVLLISERKVLVLANEGWSKGIVGLIAGRLAEEFNKPVMVLQKGELESTGSARTAGEFDVLESLKHASEYLTRFGGHKQAAGLTLKTEHFELFYQKVLEYADKNISEDDLEKKLVLDAEITEENLNLESLEIINKLEPFGVGNPKPKFLIKNLQLISTRAVGKESKHLQLKLKLGEKEVDAIYFSGANFAKNLKIGDTIDAACELIEDGWNGRRAVKLRIIDIGSHANILSS